MKIIKKDGTVEGWNGEKIKEAVYKAAARVNQYVEPDVLNKLVEKVHSCLIIDRDVPTKDLHKEVIHYLKYFGLTDVANSYQEYRDYRNTYAKSFEKVKDEADNVLLLGDRENANFDSSLVSTKGSLIKGYLTKELYRQFYLSKKEKELTKRGDIYIHDLRDMIFGSINCFDRNTKFITSQGLKSFNDFNDGDTVTVLTAKGNWKPATVHCYGKQSLNKIGIKRSRGQEVYVYATKNHRWILNNNSETTDLKVGDILCNTPKVSTFKWDSLSIENKTYWCLGFLFDADTQSHSTACSIRLCGDKSKYASRFKECGFTVTTPNNKGWSGDNLVWMHDTSKSLPPINHMTVENIKLFINGLLCADGGKDLRSSHRDFRSLQVSGEYCDAIYSMLHTAGYYVNSVADLTAQETNYAIRRKNTKQFKIYENATERTAWRVSSIEPANVTTDVWCLNVEDDHSFILEHGIPTGNCCLFDIGNVLKGGFEMSNVKYTEPTSVLSALQIIGDITLVATAQQFGGFTLAEIDKVLLPYAKKTHDNAFKKYFEQCNMKYDESCAMAMGDLRRELEQGFQSLELKLNTVPCSRGDFAFTTLTFGTWDIMMDDLDRDIMKLIGETILKTRMKGHGGKQVVFPKLVFLYDENKIRNDEDHKELFDLAVECSSKCMYPDYLSLNHGKVGEIYHRTGAITSPMGCRAYLTEWHDPKTGKAITTGRCNIGAVSLNLPLIWKVAEKEGKGFYSVLEDRLQVIREFLKKRYNIIRHTKACTNPMCFTQGGLHNGNLSPDDEIGDLVEYMTASFGITALNELSILATGKSLKEDSSFANNVVDFINERIEYFKKEDGYLYALYGTPAESLCGTQAKQYREYTGDNQFGAYFTNSFHLHVSEDVTPFEKQDKEYELFHKCNGGHIQYVRLDNPNNFNAVKTLIERGMSMGFYQGVNFDAAHCEDCHQHSFNVGNTCPYCGSSKLSVISRVCGLT